MTHYLIFVTMPDGTYGYVNTIEAGGADAAIKVARLAAGESGEAFTDWSAAPVRNWTSTRFKSETREVAEALDPPSGKNPAQLRIVPTPTEVEA